MSLHDCPCCECADDNPSPTPEEIAEAERREAERQEALLAARWTPARNALHQLRRDLARMAVAMGDSIGDPDDSTAGGFQAITVYGKRVPEELSAMGALALLAGRGEPFWSASGAPP